MSRVCSLCLSIAAFLASIAAVHGEDTKVPRTDLYGDPLPPGAVARLGTVRLRHANADVVFSKDGKQLISCGSDGEIRFWDAASGKLVRRTRLAGSSRRFRRVILSPDGASAAAVQGLHLYLFDTRTGGERGQIDIVDRALVRFSADAALLVVESAAEESGSRSLEIWDVARVKKRQRLVDSSAERGAIECAFSRDGKRLAGFTSARDIITFWDAQTGKLLDAREAGGDRTVEALAFSPDGKALAVAWGSSWNEKAQVQLVDTATFRQRAVLPAPASVRAKIFSRLAFSPDGRLLAGSYANDRLGEHGLLLWDVAGTHEARRLPERRSLSFSFAPDGKTLACHDPTGSSIRLWDTATGRQRLNDSADDRPAKSLAVSPNGKLLAADAGDAIQLWDVDAGQFLHTWKRNAGFQTPCLFSPDSARLIYSAPGSPLALQEREIATGQKRREFPFPTPSRLILGLGISADGKRLAAVVSSGGDIVRATQMLAWDDNAAGRLTPRRFQSEGRVGPHFALASVPTQSPVAFAPDGETAIRMWNEKALDADEYRQGFRLGLEDVRTGALLAELPKGVGLPVVFSPNGRLLAAPIFSVAAAPGQTDAVKGLSLIEAASGEEILRVEAGEFAHLAFTSEGRGAIAANKKGVRVWDVETGQLLHEMAWPDDLSATPIAARIHSLAVLPGGRLATAMRDGDILIWDLAVATWPTPKADFARKPLEALWSDLEGDARTAQRAIRALAAAPARTIPFLDKRLVPATADRAHLDKLLDHLDSDSLVERQAASRRLARLRECAAPRLRQALKDKPSLELRLRIEAILIEPKRLPIDTIRTLRAIDVLERIGTPEARRILEKIGRSAVASEKRAALAARQRLSH